MNSVYLVWPKWVLEYSRLFSVAVYLWCRLTIAHPEPPLAQEVISELIVTRYRVLTCIRPLMQRTTCCGPVWCSKFKVRSVPRAHWHMLRTDLLNLSHDYCAKLPLALLRSDVLAATAALCCRYRRLVDTTTGHQGPDDARHFVCECHPN